MTTLVSDSVAQPRFRSALLVSFAGLAMLLAVVGIYGVVGFNTEQRTHEISVRIALGAQRGSVFGLILRQESMPVVMGIVVGPRRRGCGRPRHARPAVQRRAC